MKESKQSEVNKLDRYSNIHSLWHNMVGNECSLFVATGKEKKGESEFLSHYG